MEGVHFLLVTDHRALLWLFRQPHLRGKLARWALDLQQLDFEVQHRAGKFHFVPDAVSRLHRLDEFEFNDEQNLDTDEVNDKAFELGNCVRNVERTSVKMLQNDAVTLLNEKSVLHSDDVTNKVGLEAGFCELQAGSFACVAVVQGSNDVNLLDKSLQLDFLNSAPYAASHWESGVTKFL